MRAVRHLARRGAPSAKNRHNLIRCGAFVGLEHFDEFLSAQDFDALALACQDARSSKSTYTPTLQSRLLVAFEPSTALKQPPVTNRDFRRERDPGIGGFLIWKVGLHLHTTRSTSRSAAKLGHGATDPWA